MAGVEVITGRERRRQWTEEQKRAIVAARFAPGAIVSDVARRADISSDQIYRWRQELRATSVAGFTPVLIATQSPATHTEDVSGAGPPIDPLLHGTFHRAGTFWISQSKRGS
jgi:hypothetical protein